MSDMDEFESKFIRGKGNFWKPTVAGDKVFGKIVRTGESKLGGIFYIIQTNDGEEVSLPSHAAIKKRFEDHDIGIGDTVLVKYDGQSTRQYFGKNINLYSISARHPDGTWVGVDAEEPESTKEPPKEELTKIEPPKEEVPKSEPEKKPRKKKEAPKEPPKEETPVEMKSEVATPDEEVKHFIGQLLKFFNELSLEDLDKYVNKTRDFGLPTEVVITMCDLEMFERDGKKFVKKK